MTYNQPLLKQESAAALPRANLGYIPVPQPVCRSLSVAPSLHQRLALPKHPPTSLHITMGSTAEIRQLLSRAELAPHAQAKLPSQKTKKGKRFPSPSPEPPAPALDLLLASHRLRRRKQLLHQRRHGGLGGGADPAERPCGGLLDIRIGIVEQPDEIRN